MLRATALYFHLPSVHLTEASVNQTSLTSESEVNAGASIIGLVLYVCSKCCDALAMHYRALP